MVPPALFVWLVMLVAAAKMPLEKAALVVGTWQNLSNLFYLDIYDIYYTLNALEVVDIMLNQGILKGEVSLYH